MSPRTLLAVPLILAIALGTACGQSNAENARDEATTATSPANAMRVQTAVLKPSVATIEINLPGEIEGSRDAMLASALGGFVERVPVRPGQVVRSGTLIANIDGDLYAASVARAEAQLEQAKAERDRLTKLGDLATEQATLSAVTQVKVAAANLAQQNAQQKRARVTAPFSGTVADVFVEPGEVTGPGSAVARLVNLDPVIVTLSVPDRDVVSLSEGMEVAVSANARSGIYHGTISHVSAAANQKTRSFAVEVEVPNPDGDLLPGMIAHVQARKELGADQLIVPQDWIVTRLDGRGVYVAKDDVAVWRPLSLGAVVRDQIVIESGISVGEKIVVKGHRSLVNDDPLIVSREGICCSDGRAVWAEQE